MPAQKPLETRARSGEAGVQRPRQTLGGSRDMEDSPVTNVTLSAHGASTLAQRAGSGCRAASQPHAQQSGGTDTASGPRDPTTGT